MSETVQPARLFDTASLQRFVEAEIRPLLPETAKGGWVTYIGTDGKARFALLHQVGDEWKVQGALEWDLKHGTFAGGLALVRSWD